MIHRHISDINSLSSVAIDDIIDRGKRPDWAFLRDAMSQDLNVVRRVKKVCAAHLSDIYDQKYHFWNLYAEKFNV